MALEGGEWSAARSGRTLSPGKIRYPFYRGLGGPQGRSGRAENLVRTGIRSRNVQPIVSIPTELPGPQQGLLPTQIIHPSNMLSSNFVRFISMRILNLSMLYAGNFLSRNILHALHTPSHRGKNAVYWHSLTVFRFPFYRVHKHSKCRGAFRWLPTSYEIKLPCC